MALIMLISAATVVTIPIRLASAETVALGWEPLSEVPCIRSVTSQTVPEAPQDYEQDRVFCTLRYQKSSIDELA